MATVWIVDGFSGTGQFYFTTYVFHSKRRRHRMLAQTSVYLTQQGLNEIQHHGLHGLCAMVYVE